MIDCADFFKRRREWKHGHVCFVHFDGQESNCYEWKMHFSKSWRQVKNFRSFIGEALGGRGYKPDAD